MDGQPGIIHLCAMPIPTRRDEVNVDPLERQLSANMNDMFGISGS